MEIKFKTKDYQSDAVNSVVNCFKGQPKSNGISYRIDPGKEEVQSDKGQGSFEFKEEVPDGIKNSDIAITHEQVLENIQRVQQNQDLSVSDTLVSTSVSAINLEVEMETGTGKTYVYIKTMFELNEKYGWNKFIIVVPSIAIREGVYQSFELTKDHFKDQYEKQIRPFIYSSSYPEALENYSSDANINVMIINTQAFNAQPDKSASDKTKLNAKNLIYRELDSFGTRRPIDLIKSNRPIVIIDEPQKINGDLKKESKSFKSLVEFNPLFILSYSATHKKIHNKIHRLDALDAYNRKLVKKIQVRGISVKGLSGSNGYMYLQDIVISSKKPPVAKLEIEIKQKSSTVRKTVSLQETDNLYDVSKELEQYKGLQVTNINPHANSVEFSNGDILYCGQATGNVDESTLRRLQIKEAIKAHLEKEQYLFNKGIKVLSLFFIDEVAKYRNYTNEEDNRGEYAQYFEEEYTKAIQELGSVLNPEYQKYISSIDTTKTHNGYFSQDKNRKFIDSKIKTTGEMKGQSDDISAYDLILKDKKLLLDLDPEKSPVRFIFSHSALREGWDNPNVFVICALKHVDVSNETSRRQEIGRGLRISVDKDGNRMDNPTTIHDTNILTVVANESFTDYVKAFQNETLKDISTRPIKANEEYFVGKHMQTDDGKVKVSEKQARTIYKYLLKNDYVDDDDKISTLYYEDIKNDTLAKFPEELEPLKGEVITLINSVFSEESLSNMVSDDREPKRNPRNSNFDKKEFQKLWEKINKKAIYSVDYDSQELITRCVGKIDNELNVAKLTYKVEIGTLNKMDTEKLSSGENFDKEDSDTIADTSVTNTHVKYDLIGKIASETSLTRKTVGEILKTISPKKFHMYKINPEDFIREVSRLINEQKATTIIEHLTYDSINQTHSIEDIFTVNQENTNFAKAIKVNNHIYDYVEADSKTESNFLSELDIANKVVVYAKLPRSFFITTPVGNYAPDWAIAFEEGSVKHVYFIAETKGSMSSMQLKEIEKIKIKCAEKYFKEISDDNVVYKKIDSYEKLIELVQ